MRASAVVRISRPRSSKCPFAVKVFVVSVENVPMRGLLPSGFPDACFVP
jgi:hypothetical protein